MIPIGFCKIPGMIRGWRSMSQVYFSEGKGKGYDHSRGKGRKTGFPAWRGGRDELARWISN